MLRGYVVLVTRSPKKAIALVLAISLWFALYIGRIPVVLDVDAQIPPKHPLVVVGKRIEQFFGGKYFTVVGVYAKRGTVYTPETLEKVERITGELESLPGVRRGSVLSVMSSQLKDVKLGADALDIQPLASTVPRTQAELSRFRERVQNNQLARGLLVNEDASSTAILMDFENFEAAGGAERVYPVLEAILAKERTNDLEIVAAGAPTLLYWLMQYTHRVAQLFILALVVIGYLHYRAFRTLQGMLIPLVTALLGVVWALGFMGLIRAPLDPWNVMTPILLLAIGAGHSVQILKRYYEEYARLDADPSGLDPISRNRQAVVQSTTKVGTVMLIAGTIAALSFGSLATFGLPSIQSFGLCTAVGIVAALIVEMTFIPALRVLLPPPSNRQVAREKEKEFFDPFLEWLAASLRRGRERWIPWVFGLVVLVAASGAMRLSAGNSMGTQFFEANAPVRGFRLVDERLAGTRVVQVLVEGSQPDVLKYPVVLRRMEALATFIRQQPLPVGKVVSIVDVLRQIDAAVQQNSRGELPSSREATAQYMLLYSMSADESELLRFVDHDYQRAVITAYLRTDDYAELQTFTAAVQAEADRLFAGLPAKGTVGGGMTSAIALNETMVRGKIMNLAQIALLVLVLTSVAFRSLWGGVLVLMPLATAALVNLGLMGWLGIPLSMGTAAISAMAVGIGADYAVYFLFRMREEFQRSGDLREAAALSLLTSGKAITYVAVAVAGGYLCLALSGFKMHVLLGVLVALTMVVACLTTVVLLPAIMVRLNPQLFCGRKRRSAESPLPTGWASTQ